ncbi:hypothetical protein STENM223S_09018 [Streptomyces tendae]
MRDTLWLGHKVSRPEIYVTRGDTAAPRPGGHRRGSSMAAGGLGYSAPPTLAAAMGVGDTWANVLRRAAWTWARGERAGTVRPASTRANFRLGDLAALAEEIARAGELGFLGKVDRALLAELDIRDAPTCALWRSPGRRNCTARDASPKQWRPPRRPVSPSWHRKHGRSAVRPSGPGHRDMLGARRPGGAALPTTAPGRRGVWSRRRPTMTVLDGTAGAGHFSGRVRPGPRLAVDRHRGAVGRWTLVVRSASLGRVLIRPCRTWWPRSVSRSRPGRVLHRGHAAALGCRHCRADGIDAVLGAPRAFDVVFDKTAHVSMAHAEAGLAPARTDWAPW